MSTNLNKSLGQIITILDEFFDEQHSDDWYRRRKYRVGASEIAACFGLNPDQTIYKILWDKVFGRGGRKFLSSACGWGSLFESCIRELCEYEYKTVIYEAGAIPSSEDQAMSPDGIAIVKIENNGVIENRIALFEFKCAFLRKLIPGGMPDKYVPQVLIGLETISICDFGIFVETVIRRFGLKYPGHNNCYDSSFPPTRWGTGPEFTTPLCWGAIAFYNKNKPMVGHGYREFAEVLREYGRNGLIDFGSCKNDKIRFDHDEDKGLVDCMFEAIAEGFIGVHYMYQQYPTIDEPNDMYSANDLITMSSQYDNVIGIMRWKMIQKNEVYVESRPFVDSTQKYARIVNECVRKCDLMDDDLARRRKIAETADILEKMVIEDPSIIITEEFATTKIKPVKNKSQISTKY